MSQELTLLPLEEEVKMRVKVVEGEPYWLDVDMGKWLGFERPTKIRELIRRHECNLLKTGLIPMVGITSPSEGGRPPTENWLSFKSCIYLCGKAQTEKANDVMVAVASFIDQYRKGSIVSQMGDTTMVAIRNDIQSLAVSSGNLLESIRAIHEYQSSQDNRLRNVEISLADVKGKVVFLTDYVKSTSKPRKELNDRTKAAHLLIIERCYGGKCPICREAVIVDNGKGTKDIRFDHAYSNQLPDVYHTWAICSNCHDLLTSGKMSRTGDISDLINAYQFHVKRIINPAMQKKAANGERGSLPSLFAKLSCP